MTRIYLTILFSSLSVAGLCLIVYGLLTRSRRGAGSAGKQKLGFSDSRNTISSSWTWTSAMKVSCTGKRSASIP